MKIRTELSQFASRLLRKNKSNRVRKSRVQRLLRVEPLEDRRLMATIDLATLSAAQGTVIYGAGAGDYSGRSVSSVGDVNGDGFDDLIIGATGGDGLNNARANSGESYVIFGGASAPATLDLANLGTAGITIFGRDPADSSGVFVSGAGDVNGDGFDDLIVGANLAYAAGNAKSRAGESYVIYGSPVLPSTIDLASLGSAGVTIYGADVNDRSGTSVSGAGDVNGDGFDDLVIGASFGDASGNAKSNAGDSYLVFGAAALPLTIDLAVLGSAGVTIFGADIADESGFSVSGAGDFNGDGLDDLLIGARFADGSANGKNLAGDSYVVFGKTNWTPTPTIDLATLGVAGITIFGADIGDKSGVSVRNAGDLNGDGFDDLIIGAYTADAASNAKSSAGDSYVVFGKAASPATIDLSTLGSAGISIFGAGLYDLSGISVSGAGDVNGDGFDDLVIGSFRADASGDSKTDAGESYLIYGGAALPTAIDIANLAASSAGIVIFGTDAFDESGEAVSGAGDFNGDGFDDLLIGAFHAAAAGNAKTNAGESYLVFGGNFSSAVTHQGTSASETLTGNASVNVMNGGRGNDTLVGNGGADVLNGGQDNDVLATSDLSFKRIVGGTGYDSLRLDGGGLHLDLTALRDNRIIEIEEIDITGSGVNTLTLTAVEVLNLSDSSNTLFVRRDPSDVVNRGTGWTQLADQTIGSGSYNVYIQGAAKLYVQIVFAGPTLTVTSGNKVYDKIVYAATGSIAGANLPTPTLSFAYFNDPRGLSSIAAPTNAGTYYVKAITAANAGNLASESLIASFTITKKLVTVTSTSANKIYNANTAVTASFTLSGVIAGDSVIASAPGTFDSKNVGMGKSVVLGATTLGGTHGGNYYLSSPLTNTTGNITAKSLIGSVTVADKNFDGNTSATISSRTLYTIESGDSVSYVGGIANFDSPAPGIGKPVMITGLSLSGVDAGNYTVNTTAQTTASIISTDSTPPTVTGIIVSGSAWSASLIDSLDGGGAGAGNGLGYSVTSGLVLPNSGVNRIYVQFSEPVVGFDTSTFSLVGVNVADYAPNLSVSYDAVNMRGIVQLSTAITKEKLRIGVSDAIADVSYNLLDGDSNSSAGGLFNFRFNILVGDANNDGSVNGGDLAPFAAAFNTSSNGAGFNSRADWNADGSVNGGDIPLFGINFNQSLPSGEPPPPIFPPPPAPPSSSSYAPLIESIDKLFSYWDKEDELLWLDEDGFA